MTTDTVVPTDANLESLTSSVTSSPASTGRVLAKDQDFGNGIYGDLEEGRLRRAETEHKLSETGAQRTPLALCWRDLSYETEVGKGRKRRTIEILHGVTGFVGPGEVLALMGPSGSGKTTLMNILADRVVQGTVTGLLVVNGEPVSKKYKRMTGYVQQDDIMFPTLSVRETLWLSARLRLSQHMPKQDKLNRVEMILDELGLRHVQDTYIGGGAMRGISGGERKRTAIGIELVTDPSLVFLDEPTSGLDSTTAYALFETLVALSRTGRTVVTSIHQPSSKLFALFDSLTLLAEGQQMYFGAACRGVDWFDRVGFPCPRFANPADYFLDLVTVDRRNPDSEKRTRQRLEYLYGEAAKGKPTTCPAIPTPEQIDRPDYESRYLEQCRLLLWRSWVNQIRNRVPIIARCVQTILLSVLLGLIYLNLGTGQQAVQNIQGAAFFILINQSFQGLFQNLQLFPAEKQVFLRERSGKWYHVSAYFLAKTLTDLPFQIVFTFTFVTIAFWMSGLRGDVVTWLLFVAAALVTSLAGQSMGLVVSAGVPEMDAAMAVGTTVTIILLLFGGFYASTGTIPDWLAWIKWLSFIYYGFAIIMKVEFDDRQFTCDQSQQINGQCPIASGDVVLRRLGLEDVSIGLYFLWLLILTFGFRLIAYLLLRFVVRPKRGRLIFRPLPATQNVPDVAAPQADGTVAPQPQLHVVLSPPPVSYDAGHSAHGIAAAAAIAPILSSPQPLPTTTASRSDTNLVLRPQIRA